MTERRLIFRPQESPSAHIALGARSVGFCDEIRGQQDFNIGRNMVQFFWVAAGCVRFYIDQRSYDLQAGQVMMYLPMTDHRYETLSAQASWHFWTMDGPLILSLLDASALAEGVHQGGTVPREIFTQLEVDITDVSLAGERAASATAYALLMQVQQASAVNYSQHVEKLIQIIDMQWSDPELSIEAVSRELSVHRSQLSRQFHKELGMAPMVYLNNRRIQKAQSLLKESDEKIAVIAQRCGYQDPAYFARVFKQHCGLTPRAFR
ncbi:MAG: helix-turn-helix transcriptional regulator [Planctomycetes bacterium]|nr:helix-turn-helix transcriptional regulator [Planctomycetota bacterium]